MLGDAAILQGQALRGFYDAAGGDNERLAGGHIPLTRCCKARVNVRGTFRDLAKLDRRAAGGSLNWPKRGKKGIGGRIEM